MKIKIYNKKLVNDCIDIIPIVKKIETYFKFEKKNVSLVLVDGIEIRNLNYKYRKINQLTDVLSFESVEQDYLGEVFICIDKMLSQADEYSHSIEREFSFLLVHGVLHLLHYDHHNKDDEVVMCNKQEEILDILGYKR